MTQEEKPLITHIYEVHSLMTAGKLSPSEAAHELSRVTNGDLTPEGAAQTLKQNPMEVELQYLQHFKTVAEGEARFDAEVDVQNWNAGKGFSIGF